MTPPSDEDLEGALGETRRLRGLARGLLYERDRAEDVVQEAWLAAVRKGPHPGWSLRAWLAGAVRRLASNQNRSDARARRREEVAALRADGEALPSTLDSLTRIETLKRVVEAVGELEEPYRETILLRFFDELTPREIAKRQAVPVETVRTRTRRGLVLLRHRLDPGDADARGRGELLAALLPMAGKLPWSIALGLPAGSTSFLPWTGALLMSKTIQLSAAALALVLFSFAGYHLLSGGSERSSAPAEAAVLEPAPALQEPVADEPDIATTEVAADRSVLDLAPTTESDWVVRGRLTLGIDTPFPNGRVRVEMYDGRVDADAPEVAPAEVAVVVSSPEGDFDCPLPHPEGTVTVIARPDLDGHFRTKDWHSVSAGVAPPQTLNPRAYPIDSELVGLVVDPSGAPVEGARVTTYRSDGETDAEGRFVLPASSFESTIRGKILMDGFAEGSLAVRPLEPGEIHAGTIRLVRGLHVTGRVVDEGGHPVADAIVSSGWMGYGKRLDYETVTTDEAGRFELDEIDPERHWASVSASKDGYVLTTVKLRESSDAAPKTELEIVLPVGGVVRGRVTWAGGQPAEDVWVCVGFNPAGIPRLDAYTDEQGFFEFHNVPSGTQTLWAVREGKRTVQMPIEVPSGGEVLGGLSLVLEDGHFLAGTVVNEKDEPMPFVMVYAEGNRRAGESYVASYPRTDQDGRFRIEGLPSDFITLGFLEGGYSRYEEDFTEFDRDDLVIRMKPSGALTGRVVDGRTGAPLESFTIRFVPAALEPGEESLTGYWAKWSGEGMTFAGTDGYWNADNEELEAGKWTGIEATAEGYGPTVATRVQSTSEPDPDALVLRLYPGGVVRGQVIEAATGRPVVGAQVKRFTDAQPLREQAWEDQHPYWTETDSEGRFELDDVPAGTMSLGIDHPEWSLSIDGPFDVPEGGAEVERRITVDEGLSLAGLLLAPDGTPRSGEPIQLQALETAGENYRTEETTTDEEGAFRFRNLLPGLYHARWVEHRGERTVYRITELVDIPESGEVEDIRLQLEGKALVLGTLQYSAELPELVTVMISPKRETGSVASPDGRSAWAGLTYGVLAEDGRFEIEGLEEGQYSFSAYAQPGPGDGYVRGGPMVSGFTIVDVPAEGSMDVSIELAARQR